MPPAFSLVLYTTLATLSRQQVQRTPRQDEAALVLTDVVLRLDSENFVAAVFLHTQAYFSLSAALEHVVQSYGGDFVAGVDLGVVFSIRECQRDDTLFLEVRLVDPREALGDDHPATEISRLQRSVLSR